KEGTATSKQLTLNSLLTVSAVDRRRCRWHFEMGTVAEDECSKNMLNPMSEC
ncbi:uncharacterized, partial [Tachysurus ichikawai]